MDWTQFGLFLLLMGGMLLWQRTETRNDLREIRTEAAEDRRDILTLIREIKEEIKDFHGRLCAIEEKNKGK